MEGIVLAQCTRLSVSNLCRMANVVFVGVSGAEWEGRRGLGSRSSSICATLVQIALREPAFG